jgi:Cu/Ag efflux pump CusA
MACSIWLIPSEYIGNSISIQLTEVNISIKVEMSNNMSLSKRTRMLKQAESIILKIKDVVNPIYFGRTKMCGEQLRYAHGYKWTLI